jgi:putative nucleotidyltransferase with HDIG domain
MDCLPPSLRPPVPPDTHVPWDELRAFSWAEAMDRCPQDPIYHAEGDVGLHTRMVLHELASMPAWQALSEEGRAATWLGCLLHDVGKPATTRTEPDGRITSKGHSRVGERMARSILWEHGAPFALREAVCGLVRYHQLPFFLIDQEEAERRIFGISHTTRADWLAMVAEADIRGREAVGIPKVLDNIELFREMCRELDCYDKPRQFPDDHSRFVYFQSTGRSPEVPVYDDTRGEMLLMSGLPGSGKDRWLALNCDWPSVSLDDLRQETGTDPTDNQGTIVQLSKERAREFLRQGQSFAFNATNLDRQRRGPLVSLAMDYKFRISIVYLEAQYEVLFARNRDRSDDKRVPERVIRRMTERWEVPTAIEAQKVRWIV